MDFQAQLDPQGTPCTDPEQGAKAFTNLRHATEANRSYKGKRLGSDLRSSHFLEGQWDLVSRSSTPISITHKYNDPCYPPFY